MDGKLLAEWFWVDRWMGSSAFLLPIGARGLYREMLTQAWRRGAKLPNDHDAIKRAVGVTDEEWDHNWPLISKYFRVKRGALVNQTQVEIYRKTIALQDIRVESGRRGGLKTQALKRQASLEAKLQTSLEAKINSPSLSPSLSLKEQERKTEKTPAPPTARSKRPIFSGQRITVFEWMLDDFTKMLGPHTDAFDLHEWFFEADRKAMAEPGVSDDWWTWLKAETKAEAQRRGLTLVKVGGERLLEQTDEEMTAGVRDILDRKRAR